MIVEMLKCDNCAGIGEISENCFVLREITIGSATTGDVILTIADIAPDGATVVHACGQKCLMGIIAKALNRKLGQTVEEPVEGGE
jgi:hypothetical protein